MGLHGPERDCLVKIEHVADKYIRVLRLDPVRRQRFAWEVLQVECHDDVGTSNDGGCQNMTIIGIRQNQPWDQWFVAGHQGIFDSMIHQESRARQFVCKFWSGPQHATNPFLVDLVRPTRMK